MAAAKTPELPELTRENLERLTPAAYRAFAFRAAVRVMPLIGGNEEGLGFWPMDDQRRHLAVVVAAIDVVTLVSDNKVTAAFVTTAAAAADAADAAADAAAYATVAAAYAAAAAAAAADAAAVATYAAAAAAGATTTAMQWDLQQLMQWSEHKQTTKVAGSKTVPTEFLFAPLWQKADGDNRQPEEWDGLIERWHSTLAEIGMGDVVQRYMDLVDGKPWNIDETERRFNAWYKEHKNDPNIDSESDGVGGPVDVAESIAQNKTSPLNIIETASVASPTGDHATTKDALGREALVKALAAFLDHKDYKGQNTIGLLGHWGAGKSSVLNMLEDALSEKPKNGFKQPKTKYLCATFNAWAYEHTDNIQAGLAQEVVSGLTRNLGFFQRLGRAIKFAKATQPIKFGLSVWGLCVVWVGIIWGAMSEANLLTWYQAAGGGVLAALIVVWQQMKTVFAHPLAEKLQTYLRLPSFGQHIGQIPIIQQQVKALCNLVLTPNGEGDGKMIMTNDQRLLLMIDDLDRCGEEGIVKTLEAVKLVMDLPNVTTIIAVDHRMALAALSVHYHNLAEKGSERTAHAIARDYLGKILTLPIQLDTPGDDEIGEYLDKVLFVNFETEDESVAFNPAMSTDENNIGEPAKEAINNEAGGVINIDPIKLAGNVEHENFKEGQGSKQDSDEAVALKKERVLVDEVVKDSKDERDQFAALSKALKIVNPRQLKRLHNSYRLLKALDYHRSGNITGFDRNERERLMAMLFWLEHVSCLDKNIRDDEEGFLLNKSGFGKIKPRLISSVYKDLSETFGLNNILPSGNHSSVDYFEYDKLRNQVEVFMLPFADISGDIEDKSTQKKS